MSTHEVNPSSARAAQASWAVTFKILRTNTPQILCVRAASLSLAMKEALEATRPADPTLSPPAREIVRCINFDADEVSFHGLRVFGEASAAMTLNNHVLPLPLRLDLFNHSPTGFEWGYGGSGPAQLALAICSQLFGDEQALKCYQTVKDRLFVGLQRDAWTLSAATVRQAAGIS